MRTLKIFATVAALFISLSAVAKDDNKARITKVEHYFNDLKSLQADFIQFNQDGSLSKGKFFLARPGKFRFDYSTPANMQVISDGQDIRSYENGERSDSISLESTPAYLILRKNLKLSGDITITSMEPRTGEFSVTLVNTRDPDAGSMTLIFKESPFELMRWVVNDLQGNITQVALHNLVYDEKLPSQLFHLNKRARKLYKLPDSQKG